MVYTPHKFLAFLLITAWVLNIFAWKGGAEDIRHTWQHSQVINLSLYDLDAHEHTHHDDADEVIDASVHHALHALDHLQFFPSVQLAQQNLMMMVRSLALPGLQQLPLASFEPPLRPPRSDSSFY